MFIALMGCVLPLATVAFGPSASQIKACVTETRASYWKSIETSGNYSGCPKECVDGWADPAVDTATTLTTCTPSHLTQLKDFCGCGKLMKEADFAQCCDQFGSFAFLCKPVVKGIKVAIIEKVMEHGGCESSVKVMAGWIDDVMPSMMMAIAAKEDETQLASLSAFSEKANVGGLATAVAIAVGISLPLGIVLGTFVQHSWSKRRTLESYVALS